MPRILPELEAYQQNLEERVRGWEQAAPGALEADLARCEQQIALIDRRLSEFEAALEAMPADLLEEREKVTKRMTVQTQMRDLTKAYVHVLRLHQSKETSR